VKLPEAFPDCYLEEQLPEVDLNLETKFNFLIVGQVTGNNVHNDRKNIPLTIKWIMDEFAGDRDVGLVVKTNWTGCSTKLDKVITTNMFNKMLEDLGLSKQTFPRIYLLHGTMRDNEVASLYRNQDIKALVSLTRGEGFGLPLLEAAASGLPVIATNWSAHTEFLSLGKYISVNHDLVPVHETKLDNQIFMPGAKWAYPSELDAKFRLRKFYESSQMPKVWAADLKSKIQSNYSFEAIAKRYDQVLGSVLKEE
jgi:glycosyltransferase involved in cell wall biosynthesis